MIRIDDRLYDRAYLDETSARLAGQIGLKDRDDGRYAVCFAETIDWLALFFAIRKAGASVLPIHPGTPYAAARKLAIGAGCDRLFYNSLTAEVLERPAERLAGWHAAADEFGHDRVRRNAWRAAGRISTPRSKAILASSARRRT
ncbi:hypothetical protein [Ensifer canadensis]